MNGTNENSSGSTADVMVVLGAQWGDEGKGKLVDMLATKAHAVCRCQGGNNAGHTVVVNGNAFFFHLLPSGVANPQALGVIGNGVVINLKDFFGEIDTNHEKGLRNIESRVRISNRAHIAFDLHQKIDGLQEDSRGELKIGTTKKGIGPTYSSKATRNGLRVCDLVGDWEKFATKYRGLVEYIQRRYPQVEMTEVDIEKDLVVLRQQRDRLSPMVCDTVSLMANLISRAGDRILIEGAQSCMLDIDFGTYPYVTSSNCSIGGVCTGLGIPPHAVNKVYGVAKAYTTRVGTGSFPTELTGELGEQLRSTGGEYGVTTGRPRRCGWFDSVMVRYAHMINGFTAICLTKLDILDNIETLRLAAAYRDPDTGDILTEFPASQERLGEVKVDFVELEGWKGPTSGCRSFDDLPINAQRYVKEVERLCGVPIKWVGVGQGRDAIIELF